MIDNSYSFLLRSAPVQEWLDQARWAPSGGNCQPWEVKWQILEDSIQIDLRICSQYRKSPSSMDLSGQTSLLALGCLAKSIEIVANADHIALVSTQIDEADNFWNSRIRLIFKIGLIVNKTPLDWMLNRSTNRHLYEQIQPSQALLRSIEKIMQNYPGIKKFDFSTQRQSLISPLARLEKIRWENKQLLQELLAEINFTKKNSQALTGIPVQQLGVGLFYQTVMQMLFQWPWLRVLMNWGASDLAAFNTVYRAIHASNRIIFLQAEGTTASSWFILGQCFQELWIAINGHHFSFQPLSQPLLVEAFFRPEKKLIFNSKHRAILIKVQQEVLEQFALDLKMPIMGFRMGYSNIPVGRTSRKPLLSKPF